MLTGQCLQEQERLPRDRLYHDRVFVAGGQPLTVRPHRNGDIRQFLFLSVIGSCCVLLCALDQRMAKGRCIWVSYVCWPFTFHLAKEKRSTLCTLSARFLSVRTLGYLALLRTNGHPAFLEVLGP